MGVKYYNPDDAEKRKFYSRFFQKPSVMIRFIYPEAMKSFFSKTIKVYPGDTLNTVRRLIAKDYNNLDPATIKFYRFEDPIMGDRKIPEFGQPLKDKVLIPDNAAFQLDFDAYKVFVVSKGAKHHIGLTLTYIVS